MSAQLNQLFFSPEELAARYGNKITIRTLANWRSYGVSPPFTKIGGRILYPVSDVLEWEKKRTVESTGNYKRDR